MTPKEKAIELVDRYYSLFSLEFENTIDITQAKRCALIALDEMLQLCDIPYLINYYEEVKQEIEKL